MYNVSAIQPSSGYKLKTKKVYLFIYLFFYRDGLHLAELANAVQTKLHAYKADDPAGMGEV